MAKKRASGVRRPASPRNAAQWQAGNWPGAPDNKIKYYYCLSGRESLTDIAQKLSGKPTGDRKYPMYPDSLSWQDIALLNYGTNNSRETNWYLENFNGCGTTLTNDGVNYVFDPNDDNAWVWMPTAPNKSGTTSGKAIAIIAARRQIRPVRLGEHDVAKCTIANVSETIGAIYIPTNAGGNLSIEYPQGRNAKLFYRDGILPSGANKAALLADLTKGTLDVPGGLILSGTESRCIWRIDQYKKGWYFFTVDGNGAAVVKNTFFQKYSLPNEPWSGYWWPFLEDRHPQIRSDLRMWQVDGPLDKYDMFAGHRWPPSTVNSARAWEYDLDNGHRIVGNPDGWWFGHCDGVAAAGCEVILPAIPKSVRGAKGNVTFAPIDIHGLGAERWMLPNSPSSYEFDWYWSSRRKDTSFTARNFYDLIVKRLSKVQNKAILMDCFDGPDEIWNYPVFGYEARFASAGISGGDEKKVTLEMELFHKAGSTVESQVCKLSLEFDDHGFLVGDGSWVPGAFRPKNVFYPKRTVQPSNRRIDIATADKILS